MTIASAADTNAVPASGEDIRPTYLDCNATAPIDPAVLTEVVKYLHGDFGNAGSRTHTYGQRAKERVNRARVEVASVVGAKPDEVIFTSGATESNNLAILGLREFGEKTGRRHIITTQIEHKAVLEPIERLHSVGFEVSAIPPTRGGWVDAQSVAEELRPDTLLVSVMAANNETGVIQPLAEISESLRNHDAFFHVDAAQAFGKLIDDLRNDRIDMVSVSGHKLYAPKGIGALIVRRRGYKRVPLTAQVVGGGQERGLRAGTLPVALIAGLAKAATTAVQDHARWRAHCIELRRELLSALEPLNIELNGDLDRTMPHTLNFSVPGVDSEAAIVALKDLVAISNGSACTSQSYDPSHVLTAMNLPEPQIQGALRFSWSHMTEAPDWAAVAQRLRRIQNA